MPGRRALIVGAVITILAIALIGHRGELNPANAPIVVQSLLGVAISYPLFGLGIALTLSGLIDCESTLSRYRVPGAATIAAISYSLYLTHKAVMAVDRQLFGEDRLVGSLGAIVYFASSLGVAWLLWRLVERPFLALRRHLAPRR